MVEVGAAQAWVIFQLRTPSQIACQFFIKKSEYLSWWVVRTYLISMAVGGVCYLNLNKIFFSVAWKISLDEHAIACAVYVRSTGLGSMGRGSFKSEKCLWVMFCLDFFRSRYLSFKVRMAQRLWLCGSSVAAIGQLLWRYPAAKRELETACVP